jgi:uncharacterized pyridoxal phosphate-containing UPF0001 family protein
VLIQVNVAREPQKSGCSIEEVGPLIKAVRAIDAINLCGLMTVPPIADDPAASRPHFDLLRQLAVRHGVDELSMGMSHDLEIAIEEGATMIRIGTAIFGTRT